MPPREGGEEQFIYDTHIYIFGTTKTLFRVWDVLLLDGLDVLFRIALGILKSHEAELLRCDSIPAVYVALESLPTRMWQPDRLLQVRACVRAAVGCGWDDIILLSLMPPYSSNSNSARRSCTLTSSRRAKRTLRR